MDASEQWQAIVARIQGLLGALEALGAGNAFSSIIEEHYLVPCAKRLVAEVRSFGQEHRDLLTPGAKETLELSLAHLGALGGPNPQAGYVASRIAVLGTLATELAYYLRGVDARAVPIIERAFLHLQRSLVVDAELRARWRAAFAVNETRCEQLGGTHLLLHGIYAFKTWATGERSDLVLGGKLSIDTALQRAILALVLTEWKLLRAGERPEDRFNEALKQARRYASGHLSGFELERFRYLVLVSEDRCALPDDIVEGSVIYRHINVAINPSVPSKEP